MKNFKEQLSIYQSSHLKFSTRLTHYIGIPLVIFASMMLASWIHIIIPSLLDIRLSWLLLIPLCGYYLVLDYLIGSITTVTLSIMMLIAQWTAHLSSPTHVVIFMSSIVLGMGLSFIGHYFEEKKLACFDNLNQALMTPLFLMHELYNHFKS